MSISTPAVSSASSSAFLMASAAESTLLTTPRRMPFDSARPMPMMSRPPSSITSPTMADTLDVPTSSPTRYRSLRAMTPRGHFPSLRLLPSTSIPTPRRLTSLAPSSHLPGLAFPSRPPCRLRRIAAHPSHVALVEPQVDGVDSELLRSVGASSRYVCSRSTNRASPRCSSVGSSSSSTTTSCGSLTSICDTRWRRSGCGRSASRNRSRQRDARGVGRRLAARRLGTHQAVDDRQIEVAVLRAELVDDDAPIVHQVELLSEPRDRHRRRARRSARRPSTAARARASRRRPTANPSAAGGSRSKSTRKMFWPRRPSTSVCTSPVESRALPRTTR